MLIEALQLDNDATQMADYLRELFDVLFVVLIKHLPVMTKEQAKAINKLKTIVGKADSQQKKDEGYMMLGSRMVKVVGEIDDTKFEN